jgi:hypothetical protein
VEEERGGVCTGWGEGDNADGFTLQLGNLRYVRSGGNAKNIGAVKKMAVKERVVQSYECVLG